MYGSAAPVRRAAAPRGQPLLPIFSYLFACPCTTTLDPAVHTDAHERYASPHVQEQPSRLSSSSSLSLPPPHASLSQIAGISLPLLIPFPPTAARYVSSGLALDNSRYSNNGGAQLFRFRVTRELIDASKVKPDFGNVGHCVGIPNV